MDDFDSLLAVWFAQVSEDVSVIIYKHLFVEFVSHSHVESVTHVCVELFDVIQVSVMTYTHLF